MTQASGTSLRGTKIPLNEPVQSGVEQPGQAYLCLIVFDLKDGIDAANLKELSSSLTDVVRRLTQGQDIKGYLESEVVTTTANLTITVGFGERVFDALSKPERELTGLHDIPASQHDMFHPEWGRSNFALQLCGDDLVIVTAASCLLGKKAAPRASVKWFQKGFSYVWGPQSHGATPRSSLNQLDDTVNPSTSDERSEQVRIDSKDKAINNSYIVVVRHIVLNLSSWDELGTDERSIVTGRDFHTGTSLSGGDNKFDEEDMDAVDGQGEYLIHRQSHLALSRGQDGQPDDILRRHVHVYGDQPGELAFSFEGPNVGLIWVTSQKNPDNQFNTIQICSDRGGPLNERNHHIGSTVCWIASGTIPDSY